MAVEQGRTDYKVEAVIAKAMADLKAYQRSADGKVERGIAIDVNTGAVLYDATGDAMRLDVSTGFGNDKKPLGNAGLRRFKAAMPLSVLDIHTHTGIGSMSERDWGRCRQDPQAGRLPCLSRGLLRLADIQTPGQRPGRSPSDLVRRRWPRARRVLGRRASLLEAARRPMWHLPGPASRMPRPYSGC